ncbi:MAG: ANTAR domain-containing protein [Leptothrix sp. (in: b-proteobacteria)]
MGLPALLAVRPETLSIQSPWLGMQRRSRERYFGRLEQKSAHHRVIPQATAILMDYRGLPESDAHQFLRSKAMLMRESIEVVARDIVRARDTLSS